MKSPNLRSRVLGDTVGHTVDQDGVQAIGKPASASLTLLILCLRGNIGLPRFHANLLLPLERHQEEKPHAGK